MGFLDVLKRNKNEEINKGEKSRQQWFTFVVQDIFTIKNQGSVVVGVVKGAAVHVGDSVYIIKRHRKFLQAVVTAIERPGSRMETAQPGMNVALMFKELSSSELEKGDVVSNQYPSFSYRDEAENPRLRGLMAERGYTVLENLESYIREEKALYGQGGRTNEETDQKGGAEC